MVVCLLPKQKMWVRFPLLAQSFYDIIEVLILLFKNMSKITIYSTPTCHFCHMTKDFLKEKGIEFQDFDVSQDQEKRKEMMDKSGQMGVPVIDAGGEIIVGFDEPKLKTILGLK